MARLSLPLVVLDCRFLSLGELIDSSSARADVHVFWTGELCGEGGACNSLPNDKPCIAMFIRRLDSMLSRAIALLHLQRE